ncbi:thioredoxin domain-containing protein [Microseira wollei]|uniref:Thioredoxin domain-containing protein n=1 Tax=Microseira wollei NIES-4236 TaxID=2530354 RepID=A0AAV3XJQ7_9CYAN|nr:thioredoxin domain-containing protein [Microseira wollei]GET40405.1 hypothetical protein sll0685 [Microseira wollei NIES-4236]
MKAHLKTVLLLGFGSLATVLGVATLPQAAVSHNSNASMEVVQAATEPLSEREIQIAQAPRGNALAAELQGKPTIVKIYADWCSACQRLRPVTNSLQQQFKGKANFVVFDVTNRTTTQAAEARARQLGLSNFLAAHRAQTSTIAVINPSNGQIFRQFRYNFNQQQYVNAINQAIARISARS